MARKSLRDDLRAILYDTSSLFVDSDIDRQLDHAAADLGRVRRRTLSHTLQLVAGQGVYDAPVDMLVPTYSYWGVDHQQGVKPWQKSWAGVLPRLSAFGDPALMMVQLTPSPTQRQIMLLGRLYQFYYVAAHRIASTSVQTSVRPSDRHLLLLRAQAEAAKDLAVRNIRKPVTLRDGLNYQPRNGTPAALYAQFMREFESQGSKP